MNFNDIKTTHRPIIIGLAVVGFITLVGAGIWLAIYSAQFVPGAVSRIGQATVYLGSILLTTDPTNELSVVQTPPAATVPPPDESVSVPTAPLPVAPTTPAVPPTAITPGAVSTRTYQIGGEDRTPYSGLADLTVTIRAVGYLTSTSTDSFIASSIVPRGMRPAVTFTIKNIGTNVTSGTWRFSASIPAQMAYIFQSQPQQILRPGERIDYTLGFDQPTAGHERTISLSANFDRAIKESNTLNNNAHTKVTISGS